MWDREVKSPRQMASQDGGLFWRRFREVKSPRQIASRNGGHFLDSILRGEMASSNDVSRTGCLATLC